MIFGPIFEKRDFYAIQKLGLFNTPRYWDRLEDVETLGTITARNIRNKGSLTYYLKTVEEMKIIFSTLPRRLRSEYTFLEDPPNNKILQGEFTRLNGNYYLKFNRSSGTLGETLPKDYRVITGFSALKLMRDTLDGASFDDVLLLSDMFGDPCNVETPVIEFSTYPVPVGIMRGRNTIIWEVRSY